MRNGVLVVAASGTIVLAAVVGLGVYWVVQMRADIARREAVVTTPSAYKPAAEALAQLCQSDQRMLDDDDPFRPAWTPSTVLKLEPTWVHVTATDAHVEFGGGFHHFGYDLALDPAASTSATNHWTLTFHSEDAPSRVLYSFSMPKSRQLGRDQLIDGTLAEYRRRALSAPDDRDVRARIKWLLRMKAQRRAIDSIGEFAAHYPHDWLDQLLAYVIDPGERSSARLQEWAAGQNDFTSWMFAAYAYDAAGEVGPMEQCVLKAIATGPDDPDWVQTHARHRGAPMCPRLYHAGRYGTCISLCDSLLAYQGADSNLAPELTSIRDVARQATTSSSTKPSAVRQLRNGFDPFEGVSLDQLKQPSADRATTRASP